MGRGNVSVGGPYECLYYIDNGDYHVYRRVDDLGDWPETRLMRKLNYEELTSGEWLYEDEGTRNELDDIETCFKADFVAMFPSFRLVDKDKWIQDGAYGDVCRRVILESNLFYICMEDNEWSMAVELVQKEDPYDNHLLGLQKRHWQRYIDGIERCLLNRLPEIHFRSGAWTSGAIKREKDNTHPDAVRGWVVGDTPPFIGGIT